MLQVDLLIVLQVGRGGGGGGGWRRGSGVVDGRREETVMQREGNWNGYDRKDRKGWDRRKMSVNGW